MLKHDMTAPKMTRVAVRVPHTTLAQINDWVDALGVRRSHFMGVALVAGVRSLMRASALELSLPDAEPATAADEPAVDLATADAAQSRAGLGAESDARAAAWADLQAQVVALEAEVARLRAQIARWPEVAQD